MKVSRTVKPEMIQAVMKDVENLKKFDHYNLTKYVEEFSVSQDFVCIVMELAKGGNLRNKIGNAEIMKRRLCED